MNSNDLREDAPANNVGSGNIAGCGVDNPSKGENFGMPPMRKRKTKIIRRAVPKLTTETFAGKTVFVVPASMYENVKYHKVKGAHWHKYLQEDEQGQQIREFANRYPKEPIILKNEATGYMCYARYGKK